MTWTPPVFTPGVIWQDRPDTTTPLSASDLNLEATTEAAYAAQVGTSLAAYLEGGSSPSVITGKVITAGNLGSVYTIDLANTPNKFITLTGTLNANCTITFVNRAAGCQVFLLITQDGTGGHALSISDGATTSALVVAGNAGSLNTIFAACPDTTNLDISVLGASGAPASSDIYVFTYGAKGDGTTDDTTAIQAAINALPQTGNTETSGGRIVFSPNKTYKITSPLVVDTLIGITLNGGSNSAHGGAVINGAFTAGSSNSIISARSAKSFTITGGLVLVNSDTTYAGTAIDLSTRPADVNSSNTDRASLKRFRIDLAANAGSTATGILLANAQGCDIEDGWITGGRDGIVGLLVNTDFSNSHSIAKTWFQNQNRIPIHNPGQGWTIGPRNIFEPLLAGGAGSLLMDASLSGTQEGFTYLANSHQDASTSGTWVTLNGGNGASLQGNFFTTGAKCLAIGGAYDGLSITGNTVYSANVAAWDFGASSPTNVLLAGNRYGPGTVTAKTSGAVGDGSVLTGSISEITLESLGAVGGGVVDDTAAFQAAAKIPGARITGKNTKYLVTAPIQLYTDSTHHAQGSYWDFWGITITTTATAGPIFQDITLTDGVTFRKGITFAGGTWIGSGIQAWTGGTQVHVAAFEIQQWTDVLVIGGDFSLFTASAGIFRLCGRVKVTETTVHDICAAGGYNAWNFIDSVLGAATQGKLLEGSFIYSNNFAYSGTIGLPTAVVAANAQAGNYAAMDWEVSNCVLVGAFNTGLFNEVNSYNAGAGEAIVARVVISDNIIINTSTATTATCIYIEDDAANPFNDPFKLDQHLISGNLLVSASNSTANAGGAPMQIYCSRSRVTGNVVLATGTNGRCLLFKSASGTVTMTDLIVDGNLFLQTNTAATSKVVDLFHLTNFRVTGGSIRSLATTSHASLSGQIASGIFVDSTCSQGFIGGGIVIDGTLSSGVYYSLMQDQTLDGFKIRNPNASAGTSGNTDTAGVTMAGAPVGTLNLIQNGSIVEDRGSPKMQFYLVADTLPTTKPKVRNVIGVGAVSAALNGGSQTWYSEFVLTTGFQASFVSTNGTVGASPATTTSQPYDSIYTIVTNGANVSAVTESRSSKNLQAGVNTQYFVRRGETITITWATSAPTFTLQPQP